MGQRLALSVGRTRHRTVRLAIWQCQFGFRTSNPSQNAMTTAMRTGAIHLALGLLLIIPATAQDLPETEPSHFPGATSVTLPEILTVAELVLSDGKYYVLDSKSYNVNVFSASGRPIRTFGRQGEGPGEFSRPTELSVNGNRVVVGEPNRRISIFDTTGAFQRRFTAQYVQLVAGDVEVLDEKRVQIAGTRMDSHFEGTVAHIYSDDGSLVRDFMPLSPNAETFRVPLVPGAECTRVYKRAIWCVQALEYVLRKFNLAGDQLDSITVEPPLYRPLRQKNTHQPGSPAFMDWFASWDLVQNLYVANDTLLLGQAYTTGPDYTDFVDARTGKVLVTYDFHGTLRDVDTNRQMLVFERYATEEPVTILDLVPVKAVLDASL